MFQIIKIKIPEIKIEQGYIIVTHPDGSTQKMKIMGPAGQSPTVLFKPDGKLCFVDPVSNKKICDNIMPLAKFEKDQLCIVDAKGTKTCLKVVPLVEVENNKLCVTHPITNDKKCHDLALTLPKITENNGLVCLETPLHKECVQLPQPPNIMMIVMIVLCLILICICAYHLLFNSSSKTPTHQMAPQMAPQMIN